MKSLARVRRGLWVAVALLAPAALVAVLGFGLTRDPSVISSATVGLPAPEFELDALGGGPRVRLGDYRGQTVVVNFWASWCVTCRLEHETLVRLGEVAAGRDDLAVLGVNYRDSKRDAAEFLVNYGTYPYPSGIDRQGRTGIDFGVYGLPETYFIDAQGVITHRHIGLLEEPTAWRILGEMGVAR